MNIILNLDWRKQNFVENITLSVMGKETAQAKN